MIYGFIWLGLVVLFAVIEALTVNLTVIWFAFGSAAALICTAFSGPLWLQITLFIVVSLICLLLVRPLAKKKLKGKTVPTNADRIIGMQAKVTEEIDNINSKGAVYVNGKIWSARSEGGEIIAPDTLVKITRIEGAKVFVETL